MRVMSVIVVVLLALLVLLGVACIGRPVVGYRDPQDAKATGLCEDDELNCSDFGEPPTYPEFDTADFTGPPPCGDEVLEMSVAETATLDGLDLRCRTLDLTVAHAADVTLARAQIDGAHIVLIGEGIAKVTLLAPIGSDASISVQGMSLLELISVSEADNLRVDATSESIGWDVVVGNSVIDGLAVRTGPDARLSLRESELRNAVFEGGRVQLRAVTLSDSQLDAKDLDSSGTDIDDSELRARRGTFLAGSLQNVRWDGCESALINEAVATGLDIGPCQASPLELRSNTVSRSILRGHVFALQTSVVTTIVGFETGASLSLFDSRLVESLLCSVEALAARGGTVLSCTRCAPHSPQAACIDESTSVAVVACPTLVDTETCDEGLPPTLREPGDADDTGM